MNHSSTKYENYSPPPSQVNHQGWANAHAGVRVFLTNGLPLTAGVAMVPCDRTEEAVEYYKHLPLIGVIQVHIWRAEEVGSFVVNEGKQTEQRSEVSRDKMTTYVRLGKAPEAYWVSVDSWEIDACPGVETPLQTLRRLESDAIQRANEEEERVRDSADTTAPELSGLGNMKDLELLEEGPIPVPVLPPLSPMQPGTYWDGKKYVPPTSPEWSVADFERIAGKD